MSEPTKPMTTKAVPDQVLFSIPDSPRLSPDTVHAVRIALKTKAHTHEEIAKASGVPVHLVRRIASGRYFTIVE